MRNTTTPLSGAHLRTYNTIFQHPISHNLEWRAVHSLFAHLGQVVAEHNGNLKVTLHGQTLVLRPPTSKDVAEADEVMTLRHFIERSELPLAEDPATIDRRLVVIDHHGARIFHLSGEVTAPQQVLPADTKPYFRHAPESQDFTRGQERPEPNTYFAPVAAALGKSGPIVVFGQGKGMSSEMEQFLDWAKTHRPELIARVVGSKVVDESHLTDDQLVAAGRGFFSQAAPK